MILPWIFATLSAGTAIVLGILLRKAHQEKTQLEKRVERFRRERKSLLGMMHDLGEAFNADLTPSDLLDIVTRTAAEVLEARGAAYYRWDPQKNSFSCVSVQKAFPPLHRIAPEAEVKLTARIEYLHEVLLHEKFPGDHPLLSSIVQKGELLLPDATKDDRLPAHKEPHLRFHSLIMCSMVSRGQIYGVLAVANRQDGLQFNRADLDLLEVIASQAAFSLQSAILLKVAADKQKLERDVDVAGEIQRILLPDCSPVVPGYHISGQNIAAQRLSGDYYDFISLPQGRLGIVIADVSGKGLPASLIMTNCRAILRSQAPLQSSPAGVLRAVNRQIQPDMQRDMFVTMIYAVLDPTNHTITLARAGHEQPILWCRGHAELIKSPGMAVGIDSGEIFDQFIQDTTITLEPGDVFLLYTDGVTEAQDSQHNEFGRDALKQVLRGGVGDNSKNILEKIIRRIERFRGEAPAYDDITLVVVQRNALRSNHSQLSHDKELENPSVAIAD